MVAPRLASPRITRKNVFDQMPLIVRNLVSSHGFSCVEVRSPKQVTTNTGNRKHLSLMSCHLRDRA